MWTRLPGPENQSRQRQSGPAPSPNTPLPFSGPTSRAREPIASVGDETAPPLNVAPPPESETTAPATRRSSRGHAPSQATPLTLRGPASQAVEPIAIAARQSRPPDPPIVELQVTLGVLGGRSCPCKLQAAPRVLYRRGLRVARPNVSVSRKEIAS